MGFKINYFTKAAGTTFDGRQDIIAKLEPNSKLKLRREADNQYDDKAIAIDALVGGKWVCIGYIAKEKNETLSKELDSGTKAAVTLKDITGGEDGKNYGVNIAIEYEQGSNTKLTRLIPDIGVGYVMFDELNHVYYDEDGNQMLSGSVFEAEHSPQVNFSYAAKAMGKSTGIKPDEILALWDDNRDLSADYGTLVHKGLETYFKNHELMTRLDEHKDRPHTATTYMPQAVGHIVDKFLALHEDDFASRCSAEVFVRHEGRCGFVDLIEQTDGGLVTHDYKFIKQLKQVKYKNYGLHDKYSLQQNFYREVIEANGHTVKDMVLDTYVDGGWNAVPVKRIKLED